MKTPDLIKLNRTNYTDHRETSLTIVGIRKDGILEIRFKQHDYEVDIAQQDEISVAVADLIGKSKLRYHILVIPGMYGGITPEAREKEMFKNGVFSDQRSISIIVTSLPQRILGNFYFFLKKEKPKYPITLYASEELALNWIRENG